MAKTLNIMDVPWICLLRYLTYLNPDGTVPYMQFLSRYRVPIEARWLKRWADDQIRRVGFALTHGRQDSSKLLEQMKSGKGDKVSYEEFADAVRKTKLGLADSNVFDLMQVGCACVISLRIIHTCAIMLLCFASFGMSFLFLFEQAFSCPNLPHTDMS